MSIDQSKKVLADILQVILDVKDKSIFSILSDLRKISKDAHGILPELKNVNKDDALILAEASYKIVVALIGLFAGV